MFKNLNDIELKNQNDEQIFTIIIFIARFMSIYHVSLKQATTDFQASMARTIH